MGLREPEHEPDLVQHQHRQVAPGIQTAAARMPFLRAKEATSCRSRPAEQRHPCSERRAVLAEPRRDRMRDRVERESLTGATQTMSVAST